MSKKVKKEQKNENAALVDAIVAGKNAKANEKLEKILAKKVARRIKETLG